MRQRFVSACFHALSFLVAGTATLVGADERPNIIYVLADDLGYGDLGCYGQSTLTTPNLDQMANEGLRFTRHYAGSTVCAPSRCVLLTGKHTGHATIRGNGPGLLRQSETTIAKMLRDSGYRTGCIGKWGVGNPPPLDDPNRHGFDYFFGYVSMWHAHNFYPEFLIRNGQRVSLRNEVAEKWQGGDGRGVATKRVDYVPDLLNQEALEFIERNRDRAFFLYYALNVPHANNEAGKAGMEVPTYGEFAERRWPDPEKGFASMIRNIDRDMGKLLAKLKELNLDEKTIVFFASDNGPHQEGGHQMAFFDSNGELRGKKRDLYEGGIRVPMIARWPGKISAGRTTDLVSGFQDVMPTIADLIGVTAPANDGLSFAPELCGNRQNQKHHPHLYWEFHEQGGKQAVVKGRWKGVRLNVIEHPDHPIELYDLTTDVGETTNIAASHPGVVEDLIAIMRGEHVDPGQGSRRDESKDELKDELKATD